jgi:hypothetical protein
VISAPDGHTDTATGRDAPRLRAANRRTAAMLAAIALLFFFGIIATRFIDSAAVSTGVVGGAMLLYLMVAIGRHLRKEPPRDR